MISSLAVSPATEADEIKYNNPVIAAREVIEVILLKRKKSFKNICLNINIQENYKSIKIIPLRLNDYVENVWNVVYKNGNSFYKLSGKYMHSK